MLVWMTARWSSSCPHKDQVGLLGVNGVIVQLFLKFVLDRDWELKTEFLGAVMPFLDSTLIASILP